MRAIHKSAKLERDGTDGWKLTGRNGTTFASMSGPGCKRRIREFARHQNIRVVRAL